MQSKEIKTNQNITNAIQTNQNKASAIQTNQNQSNTIKTNQSKSNAIQTNPTIKTKQVKTMHPCIQNSELDRLNLHPKFTTWLEETWLSQLFKRPRRDEGGIDMFGIFRI